MKVLVTQSCLTLSNPRTIACQVPLSMGFSRQQNLSREPFPSPEDLPDPGTEPKSPALQVDSSPCDPPGKDEWSVITFSIVKLFNMRNLDLLHST